MKEQLEIVNQASREMKQVLGDLKTSVMENRFLPTSQHMISLLSSMERMVDAQQSILEALVATSDAREKRGREYAPAVQDVTGELVRYEGPDGAPRYYIQTKWVNPADPSYDGVRIFLSISGGDPKCLGAVYGISKSEFVTHPITHPITFPSGGRCSVYFMSMNTSRHVNTFVDGVTPTLTFSLPKE